MLKIHTPGQRLKYLRLLAGLERKQISAKYHMNYNTIQSWEIGRNPLSIANAERMCRFFLSEGVICCPQWLISGEGGVPYSHEFSHKFDNSMMREAELFKLLNRGAVVQAVSDDAMVPTFETGDLVAGIRKVGMHDISRLLFCKCIISMADGITLLRKIHPSEITGRYNLLPENFNNAQILAGVKIISAAKIIWIRRPS